MLQCSVSRPLNALRQHAQHSPRVLLVLCHASAGGPPAAPPGACAVPPKRSASPACSGSSARAVAADAMRSHFLSQLMPVTHPPALGGSAYVRKAGVLC
jgi:hypothetical protein